MLKKTAALIFVFISLFFSLGIGYAIEFPYWIEHDESGNPNNYVWVKIDSLPASQTKTVYAIKESGFSPNGDDVFEFFDDFEGTSLNTNKWSILGTPSISNSIVTFIRNGVDEGIYSIQKWDYPLIMEFRAKLIPNSAPVAGIFDASNFNKGIFVQYSAEQNGHQSHVWKADGTTDSKIAFSVPANNWYVYKIVRESNFQKFYIDNSFENQYSQNDVMGNMPISFLVYYKDNAEIYLDWTFIKKYTSNEPTVSVTDMGTYYKIDITNNEASELTDYQVAIPINDLDVTLTDESIKFTDEEPGDESNNINLILSKSSGYVNETITLNCTFTNEDTCFVGWFEYYADGSLIANDSVDYGSGTCFAVITDFEDSTNYTIPVSKAHSTINFTCKVYEQELFNTTYQGEDSEFFSVLNTPPNPPTSISVSPEDVNETIDISVSASGATDIDNDTIIDYLYSVYSVDADTFIVTNQSINNTFNLDYGYLDDDFIIYVYSKDNYSDISENASNISWHDANHFTWNVSNVFDVGGNDYADTPEYNIRYRCNSASFKITLSENTSQSVALTCDDLWHITSKSIKASEEGAINVNLTLIGGHNYTKTYSYISDLNDPEVDIAWNLTSGFRTDFNDTYSIYANDSISGVIACNITANNGINDSYDITNNTWEQNTFNWTDGINTFIAVCADYVQHTTEHEESAYVYVKNITLIDEETGEAFTNLSSMDTLRILNPDEAETFDFLTENRTQIYYVSDEDDFLRLEKVYSDLPNDLMYIDFYPSLIPTDARLCVSEFQQFYEILIYSSLQKKVAVKNNFAQCYVLAGKTEFAYQDAYSDKIYTQRDVYYLYTYDTDNNLILLGSIDGGTATQIALDLLESATEEFSISLATDTLDVQKFTNESLKIYFLTTEDGVIKTKIEIYDLDSGEDYLTHTETINPTEFTIYFDYSTLNLSSNILKFKVTKYLSDGTTDVYERYITTDGKVGLLLPSVAITIGIITLIFTISMVATAYALGWFGIFGAGFALIILSLAPSTAGVFLMQSVFVLVLVFIFLVWKNEYVGVVK